MQKLDAAIYPHPSQIVQDAYDSLVANIFNKNKGKLPKSLCITGNKPGVGKTTVSINLAIALVMAGWKTAFIDGDLRKVSLSKRLGSEKLHGLSDYLAEVSEYEDILCETNLDKFVYIPCGDISNKNPIGLLYSQRFDELMARLEKDFDFIVIDSSALSANADASVICCKADGVFLLTSPGDSTLQLQRDIDRLSGMGVNLLGTVLNKSPRAEYKRFMGFYDYKKRKRNKHLPKGEKA